MVCKFMRVLVGPPRFELGTSCTPSKRASQAAPRPDQSYCTQSRGSIQRPRGSSLACPPLNSSATAAPARARHATIPREMSCPCFCPRQPRTGASGPASDLLPLGDAWTGVCLARPGDPVEPGDASLPVCNLGYARGTCARFPSDTAADAVRFAVARDDGHSLQIHFVLERGHHPLEHGQIEYHLEDDTFQPPLPATGTAFTAQARAYAASYLRRKRDFSGSE